MNPTDYYRLKSAEIKEADILEVLVKDYKWPIGAHAGKAGRWIIANEQERWHVANELLSREDELRARRRIIEQAHLPTKLELENKAPQMGLF